MSHRMCGLVVGVALILPGIGLAQPGDGVLPGNSFGGGTILGQRNGVEFGAAAGPGWGPGWWGGYPYGPRVAPPWGYPGLIDGPFVGYPNLGYPYRLYPGFGYPGYLGYSGRSGSTWSNGLSLYGPPVPTYGPIPGVFGNGDLTRQWRSVPSPGLAYGWVGIYAASPRPRPLTVSVWPMVEGVRPAPGVSPADPTKPGGCLILSVKVPQPAAEVFVDGVKTGQSGTDRIFESPVLEAGKEFKYEVTARWIERGVTHERKKVVTGTPGEVVRLDFTAPDVVTAGR